MKISAWLAYLLMVPLAPPAFCQNVNPGHPEEMQVQKHLSPEDIRARAASVQFQKDAKELSDLCSSIPADLDGLKQGVLSKETIDKLKRVEKLAKRVREQLAQ